MLSRISAVLVINGCSRQPRVALADGRARDAGRAGTTVGLSGARVHPTDVVRGANNQAAACAAGLMSLSSMGRATRGRKAKGGFLTSSNPYVLNFSVSFSSHNLGKRYVAAWVSGAVGCPVSPAPGLDKTSVWFLFRDITGVSPELCLSLLGVSARGNCGFSLK